MSNVACVIQCGGLWFGGKGWGITWKLNQCVVKPQQVVSVYGKCHIQLSNDELTAIDNVSKDAVNDDEEETVEASSNQVTTEVDDSDDEVEEAQVEPEPEPVVVKKVVKKAEPVAVAAAPAVEVAEAPKKKIVKKKVVS
jgi:hypothetical protein